MDIEIMKYRARDRRYNGSFYNDACACLQEVGCSKSEAHDLVGLAIVRTEGTELTNTIKNLEFIIEVKSLLKQGAAS